VPSKGGDGSGRVVHGVQFTAEVVLCVVRWYLQFPISYRDLELMLLDRGVSADHTTIFRWIQAYSVEPEKRLRHSAARFYRYRRAADPSLFFQTSARDGAGSCAATPSSEEVTRDNCPFSRLK
jgi:hypothetical protein